MAGVIDHMMLQEAGELSQTNCGNVGSGPRGCGRRELHPGHAGPPHQGSHLCTQLPQVQHRKVLHHGTKHGQGLAQQTTSTGGHGGIGGWGHPHGFSGSLGGFGFGFSSSHVHLQVHLHSHSHSHLIFFSHSFQHLSSHSFLHFSAHSFIFSYFSVHFAIHFSFLSSRGGGSLMSMDLIILGNLQRRCLLRHCGLKVPETNTIFFCSS